MNPEVCVVGQGFVGLPLALSFSLKGCKVVGVDLNANLVEELNNGITYHKEQYKDKTIQQILKEQLNNNYFITQDIERAVKNCRNIILTVGININNEKPDMQHIENACKSIGKNLKVGSFVLVRSTVIPGTTEEIILPILEAESGLKCGKDFYLAYSSERIAEGNAFEEFENMPTVVGAIDNTGMNRAINLLKIVCKSQIIEASGIKVVETAKVLENVQRDVNIAISHEFARFSEKLGIDIFEVIKVTNTHKRVNLLIPGPGVGGYCIPNAYYYLKPKAEKMGVKLDILKLSREKNKNVPRFLVEKIEELVTEVGKDILQCKIAILGLAMKDYSNDYRLSPAKEIINLLKAKNILVKAYDPVVNIKYDYIANNIEEALDKADVILVLAKQHEIDFGDLKFMKELVNYNPVYIDTKAVIQREEAEKYNFIYWRI